MNTKLSVVIALLVAGAFPALSLYAWQTRSGGYTVEGAVNVAVRFLKNSPTYKFDGIPDTLKVMDTRILESFPVQYVVTITFDSRHAGYGDRTGQVLAQVITPHEIVITVVEGEVTRAVVDDKWDELNNREIVQSELLPPEMAKDLAIEYILENYPELGTITVPVVWDIEDLTPTGLLGASKLQFVGDGWTVNVTYPVVMNPVYTISIRYSGDVGFTWEGTVGQDGNVEEISMSIKPRILSQENARDIALAYLIETKEALKELELQSSWTVKDLTPPDLLGYNSQQFEGGGWTVNVSNPVVWKPTYEVEIEYDGEVIIHWKGTVDQSANVEELEYAQSQ
jgi:hypothetical protein